MERYFVEFFWEKPNGELKFEKKVFYTIEQALGYKHMLNCDSRVSEINIIKVDGFKMVK